MPSTITTALTTLGLGENEAVLYEILLKTPEATIPELTKKSPFSRTMLYYILEQLEAWELLYTKKKGSKTVYIAEHPNNLQEVIRQEERELRNQKKMLKDVIPDLNSMFRMGHNKTGVRFFEGKEGFREALLDSLTAKEIYAFVDPESLEKHVHQINSEFVKKRRKKNINKKLLILETEANKKFMERQGTELTDVRFLPAEINPFKTGMQIYDNKISYFTIREKSVIAVIIEDKDIFEMHHNLFEYLWSVSDIKN